MSERDDVLRTLSDAGIVRAIRWAFLSAAAGVAEDYRPGKGYDEGWCGYSRHTLLRDRLNRVFSLGTYYLPAGADARDNIDVVFEEIPESERTQFPFVAPGLVEGADLNGSPGWTYNDLRLLIASIPHDDIDDIAWQSRSATKQLVAGQPDPDRDLDTLLHRLAASGDRAAQELLAEYEAAQQLDMPTYFIGHGHDLVGGGRQRLLLGRPQLHAGAPWAWTHDLLTTPPPRTGGIEPPHASPDPSDAPDARVRLRRPVAGEGTGNDTPNAEGSSKHDPWPPTGTDGTIPGAPRRRTQA